MKPPTPAQQAVYYELTKDRAAGICRSRVEDAQYARLYATRLGLKLTNREVEEIMNVLGHC